MPGTQSRAESIWQGDLIHGSGEVVSNSGTFGPMPITWAARTKRVSGTTSPEELLAAAQAGCYAMALANTLAKHGTPPTKLHVGVAAIFEFGEGGAKISTMVIDVRGRVPGLDQQAFDAVANEAERGCPVANALRGNVTILVNAQLENA